MTIEDHVLAIDLGTSGPKVALVSESGRIAASSTRAVTTMRIEPCGAEQDAEEIWCAVLGACRQVLAEAGVPRERILGIACDSHFFSVVPVDIAGNAVGPCILWSDGRGAPYSTAVYGREPDAFLRWLQVHGLPALPSGNDSLAHLLFLREERPEIFERTHAFVEPVDYLNAKLSGVVAANASTAYPFLLTDNRDLNHVAYDAELVRMTGVDADKLPPLLPAGHDVGLLRPELARELGLSPQTKIFAGINDSQAVAVGAGAYRPGRCGLSLGTSTSILTHVDTMVSDLEHAIVSMPGAVDGRYMALAENGLGGKVLEHFVRNIIFTRDELADHSTGDAYAHLEAVVAAEPAGAGGLLFLPWFNGVQTPITHTSTRGGFLNMSLDTTRTRMLRAVVEGISMNTRWLLPAVEALHGRPFEEVRVCGGGAMSEEWSHILADVLDRPVAQAADPRYLPARGTALLAFVHAGRASLDDVDRFCPVKARHQPRPRNRTTYARLFEQFVVAFEGNRTLYDGLNAQPWASAPGATQEQAA